MRKLLALATALTLVLLLSVGQANAQTYPVVVDRTAVTLTYMPFGGLSSFSGAVSYQFNANWDALVSYRSGPGTGFTQFSLGGRYHLRPPSPQFDVYATARYVSPSAPAASYFQVGGGLTQTLAPGLKAYAVLDYSFLPGGAIIFYNTGVQYELSRQSSLVAGYDGFLGVGYLGIAFDFASR